jgi:predicted ArsR family transcriptional regulator
MSNTSNELFETIKATQTTADVVKLLAKAKADGTTIPAMLEKIEGVTTPLAIKYHVSWLVQEGLAEQHGVKHTGLRGQPPKLYRLTRSGQGMAQRLSGGRAKSARKAKAAAPAEQAAA